MPGWVPIGRRSAPQPGPLSTPILIAFRKKIHGGIDELQRDLDGWLAEYNEVRPHQGRWCYGKTPMQTFMASLPLAREKMLQAQ